MSTTAELPPVASLIPHSGPWRLVDRLLRVEGGTIEAVGRFTPEQCEGHFPDQLVVPGVLLLEGMAQTLCCLHVLTGGIEGGRPFLAGFEKVRFRAPVFPPAEVTWRVTVKEQRFGLTQASGVALVEGRRVLNAVLTGALLPGEGAP